MLLRQTPFEVVKEVESFHETVNLDWPQGLFLIDMPQDVRDIRTDLETLRKTAPASFIVLLAESIEADQLVLSFAAGVNGYLLQEISSEALLESLNLVVLGEKVFPSRLALLMCGESWTSRNRRLHVPKDVLLSDREIEIVQKLTAGLSNKIIANELSITEATVKVHLKAILKKVGVQNRTQAAIWAVNHGLAATQATSAGALAIAAK
jgi:two-component system nitrate/nitrite response regulator NarL